MPLVCRLPLEQPNSTGPYSMAKKTEPEVKPSTSKSNTTGTTEVIKGQTGGATVAQILGSWQNRRRKDRVVRAGMMEFAGVRFSSQ